MIQVAVCDDEEKDLVSLVDMIKQHDSAKSLSISTFTAASSLYKSATSYTYDLIFLDIEMEAPNGYEIATRLVKHNPKPLIIFVTNSMNYTICGYGVAYRYLPKPVSLGALRQIMDAAISEIAAKQFVFPIPGGSRVFGIDEIYYIEAVNHDIVLHTMDLEYVFRATIKELKEKLPRSIFGMPHNSFLVHMKYVQIVMPKEIHLTNGAVLPVSRRRQKEFEAQLFAYIER